MSHGRTGSTHGRRSSLSEPNYNQRSSTSDPSYSQPQQQQQLQAQRSPAADPGYSHRLPADAEPSFQPPPTHLASASQMHLATVGHLHLASAAQMQKMHAQQQAWAALQAYQQQQWARWEEDGGGSGGDAGAHALMHVHPGCLCGHCASSEAAGGRAAQ